METLTFRIFAPLFLFGSTRPIYIFDWEGTAKKNAVLDTEKKNKTTEVRFFLKCQSVDSEYMNLNIIHQQISTYNKS